MSKLWEDTPSTSNQEDYPAIVLNDYASKLITDTNGRFIGLVTETVDEETGEATFALYILVPQLRDYTYRLIDVTVKNIASPYPLKIRLFAKDSKQNENDTCKDPSDLREKIKEYIKSPITKSILSSLRTLIDIKIKTILSKITLGHTGIIILKNGDRISIGFKKVEGDEVIYYTGQGLWKMYRPNMNPTEQAEADRLKKMSDQDLEKDNLIGRQKIADIMDIE